MSKSTQKTKTFRREDFHGLDATVKYSTGLGVFTVSPYPDMSFSIKAGFSHVDPDEPDNSFVEKPIYSKQFNGGLKPIGVVFKRGKSRKWAAYKFDSGTVFKDVSATDGDLFVAAAKLVCKLI